MQKQWGAVISFMFDPLNVVTVAHRDYTVQLQYTVEFRRRKSVTKPANHRRVSFIRSGSRKKTTERICKRRRRQTGRSVVNVHWLRANNVWSPRVKFVIVYKPRDILYCVSAEEEVTGRFKPICAFNCENTQSKKITFSPFATLPPTHHPLEIDNVCTVRRTISQLLFTKAYLFFPLPYNGAHYILLYPALI